MSFKRVAVLCGGWSKEREISLKSGKAVTTALRARRYDVVEIDVGRDLLEQLKAVKPEVAFIALHGRFGEDGTVQGLLEMTGIPYTGSGIAASAIGIDKALTKRLVREGGIRTPDWRSLSASEKKGDLESPLPLPVIVKPNREGSTIGMAIVRERKDWSRALEEAWRFDSVVVVESFIQGREVTVGMLNGKALPVLEVIPKGGFYDYTAKYTRGMTEYIVPAHIPDELTREVQQASSQAWSLLGLSGVARIDFMIDAGGKSFFLEVNTIPGMTETSLVPKAAAAIGLSFEDLCEEILKGAALKA